MAHWTFDPAVITALVLMVLAYARGLGVLWGRAGIGHGIKRWEVGCFVLGITTIIVALLSPLDWASDTFFSAHMTQHELLMIVAAPLVVLGRALNAFLWALPESVRAALADTLRAPVVRGSWRGLTAPLVILVVHGAVVWLWHIPAFFEAALAADWVHQLQHLMFFVTAALFFWALVYGRYGKAGYGLAVLFVFATATHTTILGALITCAKAVWYPGHASRSLAAAVDPLEDQQLAGIIMWIPAAVIFLVIALALFAAWMGESERRAARRALTLVALCAFAVSACSDEAVRKAQERTGGDVERGRNAMQTFACGTCHDIPGVPGARGRVGPPLEHLASRGFIAGKLTNTPDNLVTYLMHPQMIIPGNAMPDMGIDENTARDLAAYLYTLE